MEQEAKKNNILRKIASILAKTIIGLVLFLCILAGLLLLPPVQTFVVQKAAGYLENKIHTPVSIGKLYIGFPKNVVVENIYLQDRSRDTLLYAKSVAINIDLIQLITGKGIYLNQVKLDGVTAGVNRLLPDTAFNFQYIIDAFASGTPDNSPKDSSSNIVFKIGEITLHNIRAVYKDAVTGYDASIHLGHFNTVFTKFDLEKMLFAIDGLQLDSLEARVHQNKPLATPGGTTPPPPSVTNSTAPQLELGAIQLSNINADFNSIPLGIAAIVQSGLLNLTTDKIDLAHNTIAIDQLLLNNTQAKIILLKAGTTSDAANTLPTSSNKNEEGNSGWHVYSKKIELNNNLLQFDDENRAAQKEGMDYMHLRADSLTFHLDNFVFSNDTIAGNISRAALKEKSGFTLQQLQTQFIYTSQQAAFSNLYLKTPGTIIQRNLSIQYPSLETLQKDIKTAQINLDITDSRIKTGDVLLLVPTLKQMPAFANPDAYWLFNGNLSGSMNNLNIRRLQISGLKETQLDVRGNLKGLPDINSLDANLVIDNISSSKTDLLKLIPTGTLPNNIAIPDRMQLKGRLSGTAGKLQSQLNVVTNFGNISLEGTLTKITDPQLSAYDVQLNTEALDLGRLLKDTANYGPISALLTAKGKGIDRKAMEATFSGKIASAVLNHYNYKDFNINGSLSQQQAVINAAIADPNIFLQLKGTANLEQKFPAITMQLNIDSIKTRELHFTKDDIIYRGNIVANFPSTNPDSLAGKLFILQSLLVHNQHRITLDTLQLRAEAVDMQRKIELKTDFLYALLQGRYQLTAMDAIIARAIQPYYNLLDSLPSQPTPDYDFELNAKLNNSPVVGSFVPDLTKMDSVILKGHLSTNEGIQLHINTPEISYGANTVKGFTLDAATQNEALHVNTAIIAANAGQSIQLNQTNIDATIAQNKINIALQLKDKNDKQQYFLRLLTEQLQNKTYRFTLASDSLKLNYDHWTLDPQNNISFSTNDLRIDHFSLSRNNQELSIQSGIQPTNAPADVKFKDFRIATLTAFVQPDTTLADGIINGVVTLKDILTRPVFTGELAVNNLSVKKDTIGNLRLKIDNQLADTYTADINLSGNNNDIQLTGDYYSNSSSFDADLDIRQLPLTTLQAVSGGAIREASGNLKGKFKFTGTIEKPIAAGELSFDKTGFNLSLLNNYFKIDQEKISVSNDGIRFDQFKIKDSTNNELIIDGLAATENFSNYQLDLTLKANNFSALNSTQADNQLFYGKLFFDSNLRIKGTETAPAIDGRLKINDKTDMTVVMPQEQPGVVERAGIVQFVDKDAPGNDSMFTKRYDSLNSSSLQGMNISVNIETDKKAKFELIVDQSSGDALNISGGAQLTAGIDPGGNVNLAGVYEIEDGGYHLSFNVLKRDFAIEKGSKITWEGEPTNAKVAITAKYTSNTSPLDLVKNQLSTDITTTQRNTYLQKIPFEVILKMDGSLMQPKISFDIVLPDGYSGVSSEIVNDVNTKLAMLRQDDAEMNKQVFALLLLNRFVTEDPFATSNSTSTTTMVMQSVNKFMTEQLNQWANSLIKGIDINFDLQSTDDYSTGERQSRTDLNVGLSKRLLNDRLTVSVGSNFELDGPQAAANQQTSNIAGNISVDYRLTEDGRYLIRGYRKNNYQGIIEGYVVETGIGFVITMDYNRFREIFEKKKNQKKIRQERKSQNKSETNQQNGQPNGE